MGVFSGCGGSLDSDDEVGRPRGMTIIEGRLRGEIGVFLWSVR